MKSAFIIIISLLLSSVSLFSQEHLPTAQINKDLRNLTTDNLKGNVKSTRSISYNKAGKADGLEINQYDKNGNLVRSSYNINPLEEDGGCLRKLELFDYDEVGRMTGVYKYEQNCGNSELGFCELYTIKYDSKGRPIAITSYETSDLEFDNRNLSPKDVFQNFDDRVVSSQKTFLYDKQGKLLVTQSSDDNFNYREQYEYDTEGRLSHVSRSSIYLYENQNINIQKNSFKYYMYINGSTMEIWTDVDGVVDHLFVYDSTFSQVNGRKELSSAMRKEFTISNYYSYNEDEDKIIFDPQNPSVAISLIQALIDAHPLYIDETIKRYNKDGRCVYKKEFGLEKNYEYNTHGDQTKEEGSGKHYYENYQYDNHGNWIRRDEYYNSSHDFFYSWERTVKYYE